MLFTSSTTIDSKEKLDLGNMVELGRNQLIHKGLRNFKVLITMSQNSTFPII